MNKLIIALLFTFSLCSAQVIETKDYDVMELSFDTPKKSNLHYYVGYSLIAIGAVGEAYNETLRYQRTNFFKAHPNALQSFFGADSWKSKWAKDANGDPIVGQEAFFGSSTAFVAFTDAHHLSLTVRNFGYIAGGMVIQLGNKDKKWWVYGVELLGAVAVRAVVFESINTYYRNQ